MTLFFFLTTDNYQWQGFWIFLASFNNNDLELSTANWFDVNQYLILNSFSFPSGSFLTPHGSNLEFVVQLIMIMMEMFKTIGDIKEKNSELQRSHKHQCFRSESANRRDIIEEGLGRIYNRKRKRAYNHSLQQGH